METSSQKRFFLKFPFPFKKTLFQQISNFFPPWQSFNLFRQNKNGQNKMCLANVIFCNLFCYFVILKNWGNEKVLLRPPGIFGI